ncbi:arsenate reductase/protein-tyrosine-phosphatase family protein [Arthrobacter sp. MDT3-44]
MSEAGKQPFRILTVCTGNICRSPMAERLLQAGLDACFPGEFEVQSAGTSALVDQSIDPKVASHIREKGGRADDFKARQLTAEILAGQDLVLALTRAHRSSVVQIAPSMLRRTFTLREFARLIKEIHLDESLVGSSRWQVAVPSAVRARRPHSVNATDDDIVDPYRQPADIYNRMFEQCGPTIDEVLHVMAKK